MGMARCGTRQAGTLPVDEEEHKPVLVCSPEQSDTAILIDLVRNADFHSVSMSCPILIDMRMNSSGFRERYGAIVFSQRVGQPNIVSPDLRHCLPGRRIVALTDDTSERSIVTLLERGAHHVFDIRETTHVLRARMRAALRSHNLSSFTISDIHFDMINREVRRDGRLVCLRPKEVELARYLFDNCGRVVTTRELMLIIWSLPHTVDSRRVDTAICRVRKELRLIRRYGWELISKRCVGYQLISHVEKRV